MKGFTLTILLSRASWRKVRLCSWFLDGDEKPKTKSDPETARRKAPLVEWA